CGSLPDRVGVDALGLRRLLRDDLPAFSVLAHGAEVSRRIAELEVWRRHGLAAIARTHRRLQHPGRQQRALDGIGRLALAEMMLNRMGQRLEQVAIAPRPRIKATGTVLLLSLQAATERPARVFAADLQDGAARAVLVLHQDCVRLFGQLAL